ncbi:hypothetical protein PENTCL1PPCAC_5328, partial [Pristionchus entomophagus]
RFASSHANYLAKLTDSLIDAGHEVIILAPILDSQIRVDVSRLTRVIEMWWNERIQRERERESERGAELMTDAQMSFPAFPAYFLEEIANVPATIHYPGLLDRLREERIDAGFGESLDWCMAGLFHLVGISKFSITESIALKDGLHNVSQLATVPSYVPCETQLRYLQQSCFYQRAFNAFNLIMYERYNFRSIDRYQRVFEDHSAGFPDIVQLMAENSLYFLNSDPLVDFPRPSAARVIDIGGIAVSNGFKKLDQEWSAIFDLRPKTVLMSFGTFSQAWAMPDEYKHTIRDAARAFPHVTFIWKYEKPEHNVTQRIPNLIESPWVPQHDMLHDPRLSAFVTHCGQGSTTEANYAGVPLIVVPAIYDQVRNAFQVKKSGIGFKMDKADLRKLKIFEDAIREILENPKYNNQAKKTAAMLNDKPFSARQIFVRNMEFLAKHRPLRQLDHYGRHLNVFQYYLIDVIGAVILLACSITGLCLFAAYKVLNRF